MRWLMVDGWDRYPSFPNRILNILDGLLEDTGSLTTLLLSTYPFTLHAPIPMPVYITVCIYGGGCAQTLSLTSLITCLSVGCRGVAVPMIISSNLTQAGPHSITEP